MCISEYRSDLRDYKPPQHKGCVLFEDECFIIDGYITYRIYDNKKIEKDNIYTVSIEDEEKAIPPYISMKLHGADL